MSAVPAAWLALAPGRPAAPRLVIARHVAWSALRWAVVWGAVIGLFVISNVKAYVAAFPTLQERLQMVRSLEAFSVLLGAPWHAETVAGYTMWRISTAAALMGGIWGLRTSTGLLRGEEETGRWELLLCGRTTRRRATAQALLGLAVALGAMQLVTTGLTFASTTLPGGHFPPALALLFSIDRVAGAAIFLAIGAVTSQLSATRSQASSLAIGAMAVTYAVRMVADSQKSLNWLRWLTPFGWIEELRPLRQPRPIALVPMVGLVLICAAVTILLAGRRDLNSSILRESEGRLRDVRWLRGHLTLALRLTRGTALAWLAAFAGVAYLEGAVTRTAASLLSSSPAFADVMRRFGVRQGAQGYLSASFFFVAVIAAVLAAAQAGAIRDEEASGRLDNLLVRPVRRLSWFAGRLAISLALVEAAGLVSALFTALGTTGQHVGVGLPKMLEAGLNATFPAVFVLGVSALFLGVRPRFASVAGYAIVSYSFLINVVGALVKNSDWLKDSSIFTHIAMAPAARPDWFQATVICLIALACAAAGALVFVRRDVEYA